MKKLWIFSLLTIFSFATSIEKLKTECLSGKSASCNDAGEFYFDKYNYDKALKYYLKACELGNKKGCNNAGFVYYKKKYNYDKAFKYFLKACELGYQKSCDNIVIMSTKLQGTKERDKLIEKCILENDEKSCSKVELIKRILEEKCNKEDNSFACLRLKGLERDIASIETHEKPIVKKGKKFREYVKKHMRKGS